MSRVKRGLVSHRRHKKVLNLAKGYQFGRGKNIRQAKEAVLHAGQYAFAGRKQRRRDFRKLWITQVNNALSSQDISYSQFINKLKEKNILLDRKILAELAVKDNDTFKKIVSEVK